MVQAEDTKARGIQTGLYAGTESWFAFVKLQTGGDELPRGWVAEFRHYPTRRPVGYWLLTDEFQGRRTVGIGVAVKLK